MLSVEVIQLVQKSVLITLFDGTSNYYYIAPPVISSFS
jgi:hypothetical protein